MMVSKSDENSRALALNETVGENCFLARTTPRPVHCDNTFVLFVPSDLNQVKFAEAISNRIYRALLMSDKVHLFSKYM